MRTLNPRIRRLWEKGLEAGTYPVRATTTPDFLFTNRHGEWAPCTSEEYRAADCSEDLVAHHESSHAVGGWVCGLPLTGMLFIDSPPTSRHGLRKGARACVIQRGLSDNLKKSYGERVILARMTAFMELAGVYGSGEASSDNPCMQDRTQQHFEDAVRMYQAFLCCQTVEAFKAFRRDAAAAANVIEEVGRLIPIVRAFFDNQIVQALIKGLAEVFLRERHLSGDDIKAILNDGWTELNRIAVELETEAAGAAEVEEGVSDAETL